MKAIHTKNLSENKINEQSIQTPYKQPIKPAKLNITIDSITREGGEHGEKQWQGWQDLDPGEEFDIKGRIDGIPYEIHVWESSADYTIGGKSVYDMDDNPVFEALQSILRDFFKAQGIPTATADLNYQAGHNRPRTDRDAAVDTAKRAWRKDAKPGDTFDPSQVK